MLKNISKLELKVGEKVYQFLCDNDSPLNDVKEALFQFIKYCGQVEDQIKAAQAPVAPVAEVVPPVEPPKES